MPKTFTTFHTISYQIKSSSAKITCKNKKQKISQDSSLANRIETIAICDQLFSLLLTKWSILLISEYMV